MAGDRLRIGFLDNIDWDYDVRTPYERALGGSQSAMCYLAEALAGLGHTVSLITHTTTPGLWRGVRCVNAKVGFQPAYLKNHDVLIGLNGARGRRWRESVGDGVKLVLWTQHADDQPAMERLALPQERASWDRYALISDWQADRYHRRFGLAHAEMTVLRNAVAPVFLAQPFRSVRRPARLVCAYTSTPFRGLDVLLDAWPAVRERAGDVVVRVYSSMQVYQTDPQKDEYQALYDRCRSTVGVEYIGSVGQRVLAEALQEVDALTYPSTYPETSCIAVMESMAAGAHIVTTELGALPETTAGFATSVKYQKPGPELAAAFGEAAGDALAAMRRDPEGHHRKVIDQQRWARAAYDWRLRARQWSEWLQSWV